MRTVEASWPPDKHSAKRLCLHVMGIRRFPIAMWSNGLLKSPDNHLATWAMAALEHTEGIFSVDSYRFITRPQFRITFQATLPIQPDRSDYDVHLACVSGNSIKLNKYVYQITVMIWIIVWQQIWIVNDLSESNQCTDKRLHILQFHLTDGNTKIYWFSVRHPVDNGMYWKFKLYFLKCYSKITS